ncbi:MAG: thiamine phosphate synthase [Candidatus Binatia bacterium]
MNERCAPRDWGIYLITDRRATGGRPLAAVVGAALRGGIRAVQLRERDLPARELLALAVELRALTQAAGARLLVSDRVDVALASGANGVHLPGDSFSVAEARALLGPGKLIGVSTHHPTEVATAAAAGADFAVFGPVFATPSKEPYGPPQGVAALARARAAASLPLFGVGGIDAARVGAVRRAGADGVAVIRAVLDAGDATAAAAELLEASHR